MFMIPALPAAVRYHRRKAGLSQAGLAQIAGVGKTVIFDIEKGKETVRLQTLLRVLHALNITLEWSSPLADDFAASSEGAGGGGRIKIRRGGLWVTVRPPAVATVCSY